MEFSNLPQAGTTRSNPVELTELDHKRLVDEGVGIVAIINESVDSQKPTFKIIGDPEDPIMKSYWFKMKCLVCPKELLQLCPPKRNLETNLMNHLHDIIHAKSVEDFKQQSAKELPLTTRRRGRPTTPSQSASKAS